MRDAKKAGLPVRISKCLFGTSITASWNLYHRFLKGLVEQGEVPLSRIDDAALRLLRQQVRFAQGRDPNDYSAEVVGCEAHRRLAREAAHKSIVLLRNEGNLLPLANLKRVAVIGRLADTPNTGDAGSSNTNPAYVVTPLQGLREALGEAVQILRHQHRQSRRRGGGATVRGATGFGGRARSPGT
jgi:beta-glucosidase-like glycosyl hydrolase